MLRSGYFTSRLYVNATSAGVSAEPSLHFTPLRTVKVIDVPPEPHLKLLARKSYGACNGLAMSNCSIGS